jgi:3'(2'), 5'-bisphosphate nucleotidase
VIDEEHCCPEYSIRKTWNKFWLVDPMDGTRELISGNGEFTVNIALIADNRPEFGVIYAPVSGSLYWGGKSLGAYKVETVNSWDGMEFVEKHSEKLNPLQNSSPVVRVAASRSHLDDSTRKFIDQLGDKFGEIRFVSRGSSLKLCMIAEGMTDIYPRFSRTMEWDTAAGHAIVTATGGVLWRAGTMTDLQYNKEELANPPFFSLSEPQKRKQLDYF